MAITNSLYLHQQILLLALDDDKGTVQNAHMFQYALGGAVIAELLLSNRIQINSDKNITLIDETQFGDLTLDRWILDIKAQNKTCSAKKLINAIVCRNSFKKEVAEQLCTQGILRKESEKVLFIFNRTTFPTKNEQPE